MDLERDLVLPARPDEVFVHVGDLDAYVPWMPLIHECVRENDVVGVGATWEVELRAQVGPFARSKRLRMTCVRHEPSVGATFERDEVDGRDHAPWRLDAALEPTPDSSATRLVMHLHYGGALWGGPVLARVLDAQITVASDRLVTVLAA